jgi:3-oxoacyl-[acyl-carrier protein] reductase
MEQPAGSETLRLGPPSGSRIALVGGCGGIGREVTAACVAAGLKVAVLDLPRSLERRPPPEGVLVLPLDATDERMVDGAFGQLDAAFGGLDALVNLAGFANRPVPFDALSTDEWDETVAGNLRSVYLTCRAAAPLLRRGDMPAIVNIASGLAVRLLPGHAPYGAAKAGVVAFTKALAVELAPAIRANAVAPGAVDTDFLKGGTGRDPDPPGAPSRLAREAYVRAVPLGRLAVPEDIVGPILFLAGPASRFMTGQVLHVNGGGLTP